MAEVQMFCLSLYFPSRSSEQRRTRMRARVCVCVCGRTPEHSCTSATPPPPSSSDPRLCDLDISRVRYYFWSYKPWPLVWRVYPVRTTIALILTTLFTILFLLLFTIVPHCLLWMRMLFHLFLLNLTFSRPCLPIS